MKKAALFHGTDGSPDDLWWPWVRAQLDNKGYNIYAPLLPNNHTPDKNTYENFIQDSKWDFSNNLLIGHSSGATAILNFLSTDWFPKANTVILFGTFLNEELVKSAEWYDPGQFDNLFLDKYNPELIKNKANRYYFVHGDNDPYCSYEDAKSLCNQLNGKFITIKNGHHLAGTSGIKEFPELFNDLYKDNVL